jgi:hypothetical protein
LSRSRHARRDLPHPAAIRELAGSPPVATVTPPPPVASKEHSEAFKEHLGAFKDHSKAFREHSVPSSFISTLRAFNWAGLEASMDNKTDAHNTRSVHSLHRELVIK